jgi:hypothetical protein
MMTIDQNLLEKWEAARAVTTDAVLPVTIRYERPSVSFPNGFVWIVRLDRLRSPDLRARI